MRVSNIANLVNAPVIHNQFFRIFGLRGCNSRREEKRRKEKRREEKLRGRRSLISVLILLGGFLVQGGFLVHCTAGVTSILISNGTARQIQFTASSIMDSSHHTRNAPMVFLRFGWWPGFKSEEYGARICRLCITELWRALKERSVSDSYSIVIRI